MAIPRWLVFILAAWVLVFGAYRLWVAFRKKDTDTSKPHWQQKSVFGRTKRAHAIYGSLYVIAGAMLLATGFGVEMPFAKGCRSMFEKQGQQPAPAEQGGKIELTDPTPTKN